MPHVIQLYDAVPNQLINLSSGNVILNHYTPRAPANKAASSVTEPIELTFVGETIDEAKAALNLVERKLREIEERQEQSAHSRMYLYRKLIGESDTSRSEIIGGQLIPGDNVLSTYGQAVYPYRLLLERMPFWEQAEQELRISSVTNSASAVGGRTIQNNCRPNSTGNFVDIGSGQIKGVLPAPVRVELTNKSGGLKAYRHFYMGNRSLYTQHSYHYAFEGEARKAGWGQTVGASGTSGGSYVRQTVNTTNELPWALSAGMVASMAGSAWVVVAVLAGQPSSPITVTAQLRDQYGLVVIDESPPVTISSTYYLVELGVLRVPYSMRTNPADMTVVLKLQSATSTNFLLDFFQLMPTDSYRRLYQRGMQISNNDTVVDDGIDDIAYSLESNARHPIYVPDEALMIYPHKYNRIFFLHDLQTGSMPITSDMSVRLFYRPRVVTI